MRGKPKQTSTMRKDLIQRSIDILPDLDLNWPLDVQNRWWVCFSELYDAIHAFHDIHDLDIQLLPAATQNDNNE